MAKWRHAIGVRTVINQQPGAFEEVSDDWPPTSRSGRYQFINGARADTKVDEGDIYVVEDGTYFYYHKGQSFVEEPDIVRVIGSVRGARTTSCIRPSANGNVRLLPDPD